MLAYRTKFSKSCMKHVRTLYPCLYQGAPLKLFDPAHAARCCCCCDDRAPTRLVMFLWFCCKIKWFRCKSGYVKKVHMRYIRYIYVSYCTVLYTCTWYGIWAKPCRATALKVRSNQILKRSLKVSLLQQNHFCNRNTKTRLTALAL